MELFDWSQIFHNMSKLFIAFVLAAPVAWEREQSTRIMGLRTFPLVAVASCGYVLMAIGVLGENSDSQARIIQGLITGIGFIGGGAILKSSNHVRGTATATSIWLTGAIGASVAYGSYDIGIALGLINFITLALLTPIKDKLSDRDSGQEP